MRRFLSSFVVVAAVAGCAQVPEYRYRTGEADYYYDRDDSYRPDYIAYSRYYSALWPAYHGYYDPFWSSSFYYGVTWYPTNLFGFGGGWGGPYWSYSPWYGSWWDGYYDWAWWEQQHARQAYWQRFGSVANERAAVAGLQRTSAPPRMPLDEARMPAESGRRTRVDAEQSVRRADTSMPFPTREDTVGPRRTTRPRPYGDPPIPGDVTRGGRITRMPIDEGAPVRTPTPVREPRIRQADAMPSPVRSAPSMPSAPRSMPPPAPSRQREADPDR
ncbi:hypothetical protein [Tahibacter amnicola]|uniref:YXWGXW repeat-containing protein n=1 Tax=Tahibacter amnicola TaxID=2976241 RepID=A0ABY6BDS3_9GAMM|nr:hypothetical protein [Tahibacter amnicola]UXI68178.1 hypothetical protein N4264_00555 [Tahibacter amnicola]